MSKEVSAHRGTVLLLFELLVVNAIYYIDRCELCRFIREINSDISHVKYQFFPAELLLPNYKCGGYVPCCVTVNTYIQITKIRYKKF